MCEQLLFCAQYGEDAVKESGGGPPGGGGGMQDIFDMLSGQGRRGAQRERRGENVVHRLKVSLEEVYNGATRWAVQPAPLGSTFVCSVIWHLTAAFLISIAGVPHSQQGSSHHLVAGDYFWQLTVLSILQKIVACTQHQV